MLALGRYNTGQTYADFLFLTGANGIVIGIKKITESQKTNCLYFK
jgi:hypothetical protein